MGIRPNHRREIGAIKAVNIKRESITTTLLGQIIPLYSKSYPIFTNKYNYYRSSELNSFMTRSTENGSNHVLSPPPPYQYPPAKASNSPVLIFEEATLTIGTIAIVGLN